MVFFLSSDDFCCINFLWRGCGLQVCCFLFYFERISLTLALTRTLPWLVYWSPCVLSTFTPTSCVFVHATLYALLFSIHQNTNSFMCLFTCFAIASAFAVDLNITNKNIILQCLTLMSYLIFKWIHWFWPSAPSASNPFCDFYCWKSALPVVSMPGFKRKTLSQYWTSCKKRNPIKLNHIVGKSPNVEVTIWGWNHFFSFFNLYVCVCVCVWTTSLPNYS